MKIRVLVFAGILFAFCTTAQNPKPFANSITEGDLKSQLTILSAADMEGRETAMPGQQKAAAYIEAQFRKIGLQPGNGTSFQYPFPLYRDSLVATVMEINGVRLEPYKDFQPVTQYCNTGIQHFSEIVYAGFGLADSSYNSYSSLKVKGKAVMILEGAPAGYKVLGPGFNPAASTAVKVNNARDQGAAAVLIVLQLFPPRSVGGLGNMYASLFRESLFPNTFLISPATAERIAGNEWPMMSEKAKTEKPAGAPFAANTRLEFQKKVLPLSSTNVLGVLEGTDKKEEWLIVTAHYDHLGKRGDAIFFGADDDGSGTVAVIEIAEAFSKAKAAGNGPRRSILFMTVSGEEKGLMGSRYYAAHPTVNLEKVTANLNIDMIGRVDTERRKPDTLNYVYVVGDDKLSSDLNPLSEATNKKYGRLVLDYKFNDPKDPQRIYFRSDHYNFARAGVPIIFYYDGMLKGDYHKATDTPDKINYTLLKKRAQLVFYTAWEMASRDAMMKRDIPLPND